jgi:hypothetical protein
VSPFTKSPQGPNSERLCVFQEEKPNVLPVLCFDESQLPRFGWVIQSAENLNPLNLSNICKHFKLAIGYYFLIPLQPCSEKQKEIKGH